MAHRRFVATAEYLTSRNDPMWSLAFWADVRCAELRLTTQTWQQVDALAQYPNSAYHCLREGLAVVVFEKRGGRVVACSVCQYPTPQLHGCFCLKAAHISSAPFPSF